MNSAFLLTESQIEKLPRREHKWFRPAIMSDSIRNGEIRSRHRVFYPYTEAGQGLAITSEAVLAELLPAYLDGYLRPVRSRLENRIDVRRAKRPYWWSLSQRRTWALDTGPRLVSKYFGKPGGFATDLDARYIVVQGYAWAPEVDDDIRRAVPPAGCPCSLHGDHELYSVRSPARDILTARRWWAVQPEPSVRKAYACTGPSRPF